MKFMVDKYILVRNVFIIFIIFLTIEAKQEFEAEPTSVTVQRGDAVTLDCKIKDRTGVVQWTMNGFGLGTDRDLVAFQRYMMVGSNETGNYSLHITTALLADEAEFQCQVGGSDGEEPLRSRVANLTVQYPPKDDEDQVVMDPPSPLQAISGATVRVTCRGGLTKPVSEITWYKGSTKITKGVQKTEEPLENSLLTSVTSWVDFKLDDSFHKENISCHINHPALEKPIVRSLIMHVQYPPSVTVAEHFIKAKEGENIKFTCSADGNPPNFRFRWELGKRGTGDHLPELILRKVNRELNGQVVTCVVSNSSGNGRGTKTLNIEFEPKFTKEPEDVDEEEGKSVTLNCLVDSNPKPEIVWTSNNSNKVLGHGPSWTTIVNNQTVGTYKCRVATPGFPEISRTMMIFMRNAPRIPEGQIIYGLEGNSIDVDCLIVSMPRPEVVWYKNTVIIDGESPRYELHSIPVRNGVRSRLIVHNSQPYDFGSYNCTAKNSFGFDWEIVHLRKKRSLPIVTALVAVIGAIILLLILLVAVFLCKRQGKGYKNPNREKDSTQGSDQSSTQDSVIKSDTRTITGSSDYSPSDDSQDEWHTSDGSPVPTNYLKTPDFYRVSEEFSEPMFPPKNAPNSGSGYIPYVDYNRDYNPPQRNSMYVPSSPNIDPRFSAVYGNPYLRVPHNSMISKLQNESGSHGNLQQNNNLNNISPNKNIFVNPFPQNTLNNYNPQYIKMQPTGDKNTFHGANI